VVMDFVKVQNAIGRYSRSSDRSIFKECFVSNVFHPTDVIENVYIRNK